MAEAQAAEQPGATMPTATAADQRAHDGDGDIAKEDDDDDDSDLAMSTDADNIPLSKLGLHGSMPGGTQYRPLRRMRQTINAHCAKVADPRFYADINIGTLHSLIRRFLAQGKNVRTMTTVEMQIAYKQMTARVQALSKLFKALKRYNDSQALAALDAAGQPAKLLDKFLKAVPCVSRARVGVIISSSHG